MAKCLQLEYFTNEKTKSNVNKRFSQRKWNTHAGEKVTVIEEHNGYTRVQNNMGQIFVVPSHILKETA